MLHTDKEEQARDTHVLAEVKARKIKITKRQEEELTLAELRKMIPVHERGLLW